MQIRILWPDSVILKGRIRIRDRAPPFCIDGCQHWYPVSDMGQYPVRYIPSPPSLMDGQSVRNSNIGILKPWHMGKSYFYLWIKYEEQANPFSWLLQNFNVYINMDFTMVLILDGNSLRDVPVRRNISYSTYSRQLITLRAVTNLIFLPEKTHFPLCVRNK